MKQLELIDAPRWTGELVYKTFAGPLSNYQPFSSLDPLVRRLDEITAKRWNELGYPVPTSCASESSDEAP